MSNLIAQLKRHEGLELMPYKCTSGKTTIGVGRNLEDIGITEQEAELLLLNDIGRVKQELVNDQWYMNLDPVRKAVIENMSFNLGYPTLKKFQNMIAHISEGNFELASKEMLNSRWSKQVGQRSIELAEQMRTGQWQEV
jgi:lysozyme|tara:strand:+ start:2140 stop:2556 length:417 start_codon:yes stop_codon:yes gene_type:complete